MLPKDIVAVLFLLLAIGSIQFKSAETCLCSGKQGLINKLGCVGIIKDCIDILKKCKYDGFNSNENDNNENKRIHPRSHPKQCDCHNKKEENGHKTVIQIQPQIASIPQIEIPQVRSPPVSPIQFRFIPFYPPTTPQPVFLNAPKHLPALPSTLPSPTQLVRGYGIETPSPAVINLDDLELSQQITSNNPVSSGASGTPYIPAGTFVYPSTQFELNGPQGLPLYNTDTEEATEGGKKCSCSCSCKRKPYYVTSW